MVHLYTSMPRPARELAGKVVILEAPAGTARQMLLQQCLQEAEQTLDAATWLLACNFSMGGAWAGLQDLLAAVVSQVEQQDPELLSAHSYELCLAAPSLRRRISVQHPTLTELAQGHERVRNYPADRAYRSLHGLIDFLDTWRQTSVQNPLMIACDQFDQSSPLVQRFFRECVRRCADRWQLTLLLAVSPGNAQQTASQFSSQTAIIVQLPLPPDPPQPMTREQALAEAQHLQQQVEDDPAVADIATPRLIDLWEQAGDTQAAVRWQIQAMHRFNQLGLYGAGLRYCTAIEARLEEIGQRDFPLYSTAVISLYFCYLTLGHVEQAYTLIKEKVIDQIHTQPSRSHNYYLLAMLYARFLPQRDLPKAVECLEYGLSLLASADLSDAVRYFYIVFLKNGLAYIRAQQKQPAEAVALCQEGLGLLDRFLAPEQHRLHRSVLVYNIAQVYAATGQTERALETFSMVIAMDPYYSEYYNERGAIFFKDGNLRAAERDYLRAIELSPPYPEVWINLGQCYREMERREDAIAAYTRALDLDPQAVLPLIGRAEMYAECEQAEQALQDYDAALCLEPQQPLVLAARAVVHYELGQLLQAINDLDNAIALAPDQALFYHNRATALSDLKRFREARRDLERYLHLQPDAEDRSEIEQKLAALRIAQQ
jgi:tetratricopeptide (TPR) repeat protein